MKLSESIGGRDRYACNMREKDTSVSKKPAPVRRRGRPKGDEVRVAILAAASELLGKKGFAKFTIEAVALKSGAARSSIYRWWPTRGALGMAALMAEARPRIAYPATASAIDDIRQQMMRVAEVYSGSVGRIIATIVAEGQADHATMRAMIEGYVLPRRDEARLVLERAVAIGELRADLNPDLVIDALYGPIWYRLLVPHQPLTVDWVSKLADIVLGGLQPGAIGKPAR